MNREESGSVPSNAEELLAGYASRNLALVNASVMHHERACEEIKDLILRG